MRRNIAGSVALATVLSAWAPVAAQNAGVPVTGFRFHCGADASRDAVPLTPSTLYSPERGYGFRSPIVAPTASVCASDRPFLFDLDLPEGNYDVTVTLGDPAHASEATVKAESRRLMLEQVRTRANEFVTRTFTVNVRTPAIPGGDSVRLKTREIGSATWDDRLTLEFNGAHPAVRDIRVTPARNPVTVFLAGNSTVVDQTTEPWAAWGQMIPRFFKPGAVVIANHAESGETLKAFINERRLAKVLSAMKRGDYLFIEFAHNDQKPGSNYLEPFTTYKAHLEHYIAEARARGAIPVLVTSMLRRRFDGSDNGLNCLLNGCQKTARSMGCH